MAERGVVVVGDDSDRGCGDAVTEELKDDTPGVSGEVMLVNTDSFEECNQDLDTQVSGGEAGPESPIRKVQREQVGSLLLLVLSVHTL